MLLVSSYLLLAIALLIVIAKLYFKFSTRWNNSYTCLVGKTAIVTGSNTGIGYWTALDLAKRGARVILACRDETKAENARNTIIKETNNDNVVVKLLDLSSFESVRKFADDINQTEPNVNILVNNAAIAGVGDKLSKDGLQLQLQTNHVSVALLTNLLLDKLKVSAPSRIVNVSSIIAKNTVLDPNELKAYPSNKFNFNADILMYARSKLCNILYTLELSERLKGTNVTVNCLHPGVIKTELVRHMPALMKKVWNFMANMLIKTAEEGAQTNIYLAVSKEVEGVSGCLFEECKKVDLYPSATKPNLAKEVWDETEKLFKSKGV